LAVGMGAPDLLKRTDAPRDVACYVIGLNVVLMPLLVIYLPIAVAIHRAVFHHDVSLPWFIVAKVVLAQASLPFFVGLALARWRPNVADPIARHAPRFVGNTMLVVGVVAIFATWRSLLSFGAGVWLTCLTVATVAVLTGHLVGGPTLANKAVLAGFSAVRFPALALLILSVVPRGQRLIPLVIAYTISSAVVVSIY